MTRNEDHVENEHDEFLKKVGAYVDGELSPKEREDIEQKIREDSSLREATHTYRWMDELARREPTPEIRDDQRASLWNSIEARKNEPVVAEWLASDDVPGSSTVLRPEFRRWAAVAAALAIFALGGYFAYQFGSADVKIVNDFTSENTPDHDGSNDAENVAEYLEGEKPTIREGSVKYDDF